MYDCGKITTPEYVVDKGAKLETIFDRIHLVDTRFEIIRRDAIIHAIRKKLEEAGKSSVEQDEQLQQELARIEVDREYIRRCNIGSEYITPEQIIRINSIADNTWQHSSGKNEKLLLDEEASNLQIGRGTLSVREREIINNHVSVTIKMLESLPYPKHLRRLPEYAGGHHEKMDGTGYPHSLTKEEMSIPARMLAIADVFEALTASDRPYKKVMGLAQSLTILGRMKSEGHVDPDLFDVFIHKQVYLDYARQHLKPEQLDVVDIKLIPGYRALM